MFGLLARARGFACLGWLALAALGMVAEAHAEPGLEFALVVSGGMTGAVTSQILVYDDGSVIHLGAAEQELGPYGVLPEPDWLIARLDAAARDRLFAELSASLKRGAACEPGSPIPDGVGASLFEIHPGEPPRATVHDLNLMGGPPKDAACRALVDAYERLAALGALPAEPWQPRSIVVTVTAPASPFIAQAEPLQWPAGWRGVDDPATAVDAIGRFMVILDAAPEVRRTLNDLILTAREQGRPVMIDGKLYGIAFAEFALPGEALLDAATPPDR